jgi:hypothetical protein
MRSAVGRDDDHGGSAKMRIDVGRAAAGAAPWPDAVARPRPVDPVAPAGADKAAATPYGDLESALRTAALRRDAAPAPAAGAPAVPTTAEQLALQRAATTAPTALTVTTALAAYAAAVATAPPRPAHTTGPAPASHPEEEEAPDSPESSEEPAPRDGPLPGGYSSRA